MMHVLNSGLIVNGFGLTSLDLFNVRLTLHVYTQREIKPTSIYRVIFIFLFLEQN